MVFADTFRRQVSAQLHHKHQALIELTFLQ